jgi:hypothetical protein
MFLSFLAGNLLVKFITMKTVGNLTSELAPDSASEETANDYAY